VKVLAVLMSIALYTSFKLEEVVFLILKNQGAVFRYKKKLHDTPPATLGASLFFFLIFFFNHRDPRYER
jgi:hypothetical protein